MGKKMLLVPFTVLSFLLLFSCAAAEDNGNVLVAHGEDLPYSFHYDGTLYHKSAKNLELDSNMLGDFLGYLVNEKDLEAWRSVDEPGTVYLVNTENYVSHLTGQSDCYDCLKDRFDAYKVKNSDDIAIDNHWCYIRFTAEK